MHNLCVACAQSETLCVCGLLELCVCVCVWLCGAMGCTQSVSCIYFDTRQYPLNRQAYQCYNTDKIFLHSNNLYIFYKMGRLRHATTVTTDGRWSVTTFGLGVRIRI